MAVEEPLVVKPLDPGGLYGGRRQQPSQAASPPDPFVPTPKFNQDKRVGTKVASLLVETCNKNFPILPSKEPATLAKGATTNVPSRNIKKQEQE
jgi:hypothetical protein